MFTDLFLLSIFFVANILIALSLFAYSWLYIDAYRLEHKSFDLFRAIGTILFGFSFIFAILARGVNDLSIVVQFIGIALVCVGTFKEEIPKVPNMNTRINIFNPIILLSGLFSFGLTFLIGMKTREKVTLGLGKQFKVLQYFWFLITLFLFIQFLTFLGANYFVAIDALTRQYSVVWTFNQALLVVTSIVLFRWISQFISFRIFPSIFLSIWQGAILLTVILATGYSVFTISQSEAQVFELLSKNAKLVEFNINQIKENNSDLVKVLAGNPKMISAFESKNAIGINDQLEGVLNVNSNLDKIQAIDRIGVLISDSENPDQQAVSVTGDQVIANVLKDGTLQSDINLEHNDASGDRLNIEVASPIYNSNNELVGIINVVKRINNSFLDYIKKQTTLEAILYVNDVRSASTILENDQLSRVEKVPYEDSGEIFSRDGDINFVRTQIQTVPYYASIINIKDSKQNIKAKLIVATPQSILLNAIQQALLNTFILTLVLATLATIPSYRLAKRFKRDFNS